MLTGDPTYWKPMKPHVTLFDLDDVTYGGARFIYDPFTSNFTHGAVIKLGFESSTTNVGQCFVTIENSTIDDIIVPEDGMMNKGARIKIELSKDGTNWQVAFKGLVRAYEHEAFGETGTNLTFTGYGYMIRTNERMVKLNKESSKTGGVYNRTDSTMFTDQLVQDIIKADANHIYLPDDDGFLGYQILKDTNLLNSPVTQWIPKVDVEYGTEASAIDEVLEYSGALLTLDQSNDQLVLYDPNEQVSGMGVFVITNQVNKLADDAAYTMYPIENARYRIGWDTDESANRLIFPFKHPGSHLREDYPEWDADRIEASYAAGPFDLWEPGANVNRYWAQMVEFDAVGSPGVLRVVLHTYGNTSGWDPNSTKCWIAGGTSTSMGAAFGGPYDLWPQAPDGTFPTDGSISFPSSTTEFFVVGMADNVNMAQVTTGKVYWIWIGNPPAGTPGASDTTHVAVIADPFQSAPANNNSQWLTTYSDTDAAGWASPFVLSSRFRMWNIPQHAKGEAELNLDWVVTAEDRTTSRTFGGWLGPVEKVITSAPQHIDSLATIQEYLYPRIYYASKARIAFDYPNLTMPNNVPKAGDICCHYDTQLHSGTRLDAIQTGVISDVRYDFDQDSDGVLGLRKLSLSTSGIRRGMY